MKSITLLIFVFLLTINSYGQGNSYPKDILETQKTVKVKLHNYSMKRFELYVPGVRSIEAVRFGTNTFCMKPGQEILFSHEGRNYSLLTANVTDDDKLKYNLRRLVKHRMKELNLN